MGKKKVDVMEKEKPVFVEGAIKGVLIKKKLKSSGINFFSLQTMVLIKHIVRHMQQYHIGQHILKHTIH